jgi:NTE family protein
VPHVENLVFQGGGVRAAAYAGAVRALAARGHLATVRRVAGTSAGSMTAAILAVGADAEGLERSVRDTPFARFLDGGCWPARLLRLWRRYGEHPGRVFSELMRRQLATICGYGEITFGALEELRAAEPARYRELSVVASDVGRQRAIVFSAKHHPDLPIWQAVRCSVSIPFVFTPERCLGSSFVDGGLTWDYPIDLYDPEIRPSERQPGKDAPPEGGTLGFCLGTHAENRASHHDWRLPHVRFSSLPGFLEAMAGLVVGAANRAHVRDSDLARTVFIDVGDVAATDFRAPPAVIERLIERGEAATARFLDDHLGWGA